MATTLVVYDSKYGQTEKIARFVADVARDRGHRANVVHVGADLARDAVTTADMVFVLAPVFAGKHLAAVHAFVVAHRQAMAGRPTAFFSVSASGGSKDPSERAEAERVAREFLTRAGWRPSFVECFGGAIAYPRYNPILRFVCKLIAKKNGGPTDTSRIHELTDWPAVERATMRALRALGGAPRRTPAVVAAAP